MPIEPMGTKKVQLIINNKKVQSDYQVKQVRRNKKFSPLLTGNFFPTDIIEKAWSTSDRCLSVCGEL